MHASGTLLQRCCHSRVLQAKLTPQSYGFLFAQILIFQGFHDLVNHFGVLIASHLADLNNELALFSHFLCAKQIGLSGFLATVFEILSHGLWSEALVPPSFTVTLAAAGFFNGAFFAAAGFL